jgi:hypothetical protein
MMAELVAQLQQVKRAFVYDLLSKRNVVGVGLGHKVSHGVDTGEMCIVISVTRKFDVSILATEDLVPQELEGFKTDVVETGILRAFQQSPQDRWRPAPPGVSIGHYLVTAGTFGCLVRRDEEDFILSNNHVLANSNDSQLGDAVLQPGAADGGTMDDRIATLADYVPIDFGTAPPECSIAEWSAKTLNYIAGAFGSSHQLQAVKQTEGVNRVDAALAQPISPDVVINEILNIGAPTGVGTATLGTPVQKSGRTTGHTQGTIIQIDATVSVNYNGPTAVFTGQLVAGPMSQPGDSGSAVLDMDGAVVGLLFAGSEVTTIINPIDEVFSALNVELAL